MERLIEEELEMNHDNWDEFFNLDKDKPRKESQIKSVHEAFLHPNFHEGQNADHVLAKQHIDASNNHHHQNKESLISSEFCSETGKRRRASCNKWLQKVLVYVPEGQEIDEVEE